MAGVFKALELGLEHCAEICLILIKCNKITSL